MATVMHDSFGPMHTESGAPQRQKKATTARMEERNEMNDAIGQKTPPSAAFFWVSDEEDAELGVAGPVDRIQGGTAQIEDHTFVRPGADP